MSTASASAGLGPGPPAEYLAYSNAAQSEWKQIRPQYRYQASILENDLPHLIKSLESVCESWMLTHRKLTKSLNDWTMHLKNTQCTQKGDPVAYATVQSWALRSVVLDDFSSLWNIYCHKSGPEVQKITDATRGFGVLVYGITSGTTDEDGWRILAEMKQTHQDAKKLGQKIHGSNMILGQMSGWINRMSAVMIDDPALWPRERVELQVTHPVVVSSLPRDDQTIVGLNSRLRGLTTFSLAHESGTARVGLMVRTRPEQDVGIEAYKLLRVAGL